MALSTTSKTSASQGLHTVTFPTTPPSIQTSIKASSTPTSSDTGPTVTVTSPPSPLNKSNGISAGDMAGIAVAAVALLVLGAGLGILWKRKNFLKGSGGRGRVERVVAHTREWKAELDGSARHLREEKQRAWELEGSGRPIGGRARSTIYELPGR